MLQFKNPLDAQFVTATAPDALLQLPLLVNLRHKVSKILIPAGTVCTIAFGEANGKWKMRVGCVVEADHEEAHISMLTADVGRFFQLPSQEQLEEWVSDSICESVLGENVEPDGFDENGAPSWLVALKLI